MYRLVKLGRMRVTSMSLGCGVVKISGELTDWGHDGLDGD
jgi:hypothetical protein